MKGINFVHTASAGINYSVLMPLTMGGDDACCSYHYLHHYCGSPKDTNGVKLCNVDSAFLISLGTRGKTMCLN